MKDQLEALVAQMYQSGILYSEAVREFRKRFILTVLEQNNGNQCKAAKQLGMHRNTLSRTITELELDVRAVRAGSRRPPQERKSHRDGEEDRSLASRASEPTGNPVVEQRKSERTAHWPSFFYLADWPVLVTDRLSVRTGRGLFRCLRQSLQNLSIRECQIEGVARACTRWERPEW